MRTPVLIRTTFSDRMLPLALPRRTRRSRWNREQLRSTPDQVRVHEVRGQMASAPRANARPLLRTGAIAERFIRQVGLDFFSATASSLFGDSPEAWMRKAGQAGIAELA